MNKHSVTKKRLAKPSHNRGMRKSSPRKALPRKVSARPAAVRKPKQTNGLKITAMSIVASILNHANGGNGTVTAVAAIGSALQSHKFQVGQTVFYTSSPISRPGASGSYKVVRLLPSDGDDYQYRIKHAGEAFERVAKESQLELES
jgi:hypothetical protein